MNELLEELDKFMVWWVDHYSVKSADDIRSDVMRPLYVAWINWKNENTETQS